MGEICLEWENHDKDLATKLWEFCNEEYLVDFSITFHGQEKKVHKCVLVLLMPILKGVLRSSGNLLCDQEEISKDGSPGESTDIPRCFNLDSVAHHAEDIDYLIEFVYTGKTKVPKEHADCMLHIADSMRIQSLKKSICQWHYKGKLADKPKYCDVATQCSPEPRIQLKNVMQSEEGELIVCSNLNLPFIVVEEPTLLITSLNDIDKNNQNGLSQKCKSKDDFIEKKTTETPLEVTKTDFNEEAKIESHENILKEKQETSLNDGANLNESLDCLKQFTSEVCTNGFEDETQDVVPSDTKFGTEVPKCKYCGHTTRRIFFLKRHIMAIHHVDMDGNALEMNVNCTKCDFVCYTKHQLQAHERTKHDHVGRHKCKECSFTAPNTTRMKKHERLTHSNIREFVCEECGKRFQTKEVLNNHVMAVHMGVKPFICDICGTKYKHRKQFNLHMACHNNDEEYIYVCDTCGYRSRCKLGLSRHMRREHGVEFKKSKRPKQELPTDSFDLETLTIEYMIQS